MRSKHDPDVGGRDVGLPAVYPGRYSRKTPNIKRGKDRGKAPTRDEGEYPWFCKGGEFVGERVNDMHLLSADKQAGRKLKGVEM